MPDVTHSIDLLARKPATIRFHSLQEDGTLTIFIIRTGEESRELLSITFRTFTDYLITRYDHSGLVRGKKYGWFRTVGYRHLISTEDRLFEVTSEGKPQCSIVWQQKTTAAVPVTKTAPQTKAVAPETKTALKETKTTAPETRIEPRASTWQELLEILESVLENDEPTV